MLIINLSYSLVALEKIITQYGAKHALNRSRISPVINFITYKKSACYKLRLRTCPSCIKKRLFLGQEGHVLERRRASSLFLKGIYSFREGRKILTNSRRVKE
jgi:hypothetical protein